MWRHKYNKEYIAINNQFFSSKWVTMLKLHSGYLVCVCGGGGGAWGTFNYQTEPMGGGHGGLSIIRLNPLCFPLYNPLNLYQSTCKILTQSDLDIISYHFKNEVMKYGVECGDISMTKS